MRIGVVIYLENILLKVVICYENLQVDTADNAIRALSMIQQKLYGLVFLDIRLPGMSGIELYEQIKSKAPYLTKRIVFITGDFLAPLTNDFLFRNKVFYVAKPLDWNKLVEAVDANIC